MSRLDDLHAALIRADSAGNKADAQILADAIRAEEAGGKLEQFGPGMGRSGPSPGRLANERDAFMRSLPPPPNTEIGNFVEGNLAGAVGTGFGTAQTAAHINLPAQAVNYGLEQAGLGKYGPVNVADKMAGDFLTQSQNDPALRTGAGRAGQLTGGMLATAPLAALAAPAEGATLLNAGLRGAGVGGAAAATQPVDPANFWGDKAGQTAGGAALGAGIPLGVRGIAAGAERVWGPNWLAQISNFGNARAGGKPFAQESEDLAARTGVEFTPAQVSGSRVSTALENMSRQSIFSADKAFEADSKIAGQAVTYINKVMDNISQHPASALDVGTQVQTITRGAVERLATGRETFAAKQYGAIDRATRGQRFVRPDNAMREADAIIAEYGAVPTPEARRIVQQAQAMRDRMAEHEGYTFGEAQRSRSYYGKGARGGASVFDEVNPDINRQISTRLFGAFDRDMQQSAERVGDGNLAAQINRANATYRRYSQAIDAVESHPIGRLFGDNVRVADVMEFNKLPPETVVDRITNMHPSEINMVRTFMSRNAPDTWQQYKRLLVGKALAEAETLPTTAGANHVPFSAASFVRALGGNKPEKIQKLNAIFNANEMREIDDAFKVARRLGDRFGYNASGTGPYNEVQSFLKSVTQRGVSGVVNAAGGAIGMQKIANVMANADGRRAIIQLSRLPPQSKQAASLVSYLSALMNGQSATRSNNPNRGNAQALQ